MAILDFSTIVASCSAIIAVVLGSVFVYFHRELESYRMAIEKNRKDLEDKERSLVIREAKLEQEQKALAESQAALKALEDCMKQQSDSMDKREETLQMKTKELQTREFALTKAETIIKAREEELQLRVKDLEKRVDYQNDDDDVKTAETEVSFEEDDQKVKADSEPSSQPAETVSSSEEHSEAEKRKKMIDEELTKLIKEADENELEDPFDEPSIEALKKAAHKICYLKKYYDVMKDSFIYFPSVTKTLVDYSLLEEAEKYYFEEEDEFPQDLSIGIRSVATMAMAEKDDDMDEDYMLALAQDVVL